MSKPPNIEKFNKRTGQIFASLYENFPVPRAVLTSDFGAGLAEDCIDNKMAYDESDFILATIQWLNASGYITYSDMNSPYGPLDAVLTSKGLEVLNAIPTCLEGGKSIGETLVDAVKSGADGSVRDAVKVALAKGAELIPWGSVFKALL